MDKVIFFHMNQLGDFLFSLPVLEAARREWPEKKLISFIKPELASLAKISGYVDDVIEKKNRCFLENIKNIKEGKFSEAILFSESPESLLLSYFSKIPERIGFKAASLGFLLNIAAEKSGVPSIKNNISLGQKSGLVSLKEDYSGLLKIPQVDIDNVDEWLSRQDIPKEKLVVVSPGTSRKRKNKSWEMKNWEKVLDFITDKGFSPVLAGSPAEKGEFEEISKNLEKKVPIFTDFGIISLGGLLSSAKFFLGVDSGAMHLAATLKVPVIALFGPTDPSQIGPMPLNVHTVIKKERMPDISADEVISRIKEKL